MDPQDQIYSVRPLVPLTMTELAELVVEAIPITTSWSSSPWS